MKIPTIFQWPSPWVWGAIAVIALTNADHFFGVVQGAAVLTLVAAGIYFIRNRTCGRRSAVAPSAASSSSLDERLQTIERRLTDTQDVMIALSEKVDQWEAERTRGVTTPGQPS